MKPRIDKKPTWGVLYAIALLLVALSPSSRSPSRTRARSVLEVVVVITMFRLMAQWLRRNRVVLELEQRR